METHVRLPWRDQDSAGPRTAWKAGAERRAQPTAPRPCQIGQKTSVTSGHPRAPRTASDLGTRRSATNAKRPSKLYRPGGRAALRIGCGAAGWRWCGWLPLRGAVRGCEC